MKALELKGKVDEKGVLRVETPLRGANTEVKVIILVPEAEDELEDSLWLQSIARNSAFDFLADKAEDIYSLTDGEPLTHEA